MHDALVVAICDIDEAKAPPVVFDLGKNYQACFSRAVREFVRGVRDNRPFATDRLDNLGTLKLMEASYVAAGVKL